MRLTPLKPSDVMKALKKMGGENISRGLLRKILHEIGVDWKTFKKYQ